MREVIIRKGKPVQDDSDRVDRLVSLLATGLERMLGSEESDELPDSSDIDFSDALSPNTHAQDKQNREVLSS